MSLCIYFKPYFKYQITILYLVSHKLQVWTAFSTIFSIQIWFYALKKTYKNCGKEPDRHEI